MLDFSAKWFLAVFVELLKCFPHNAFKSIPSSSLQHKECLVKVKLRGIRPVKWKKVLDRKSGLWRWFWGFVDGLNVMVNCLQSVSTVPTTHKLFKEDVPLLVCTVYHLKFLKHYNWSYYTFEWLKLAFKDPFYMNCELSYVLYLKHLPSRLIIFYTVTYFMCLKKCQVSRLKRSIENVWYFEWLRGRAENVHVVTETHRKFRGLKMWQTRRKWFSSSISGWTGMLDLCFDAVFQLAITILMWSVVMKY